MIENIFFQPEYQKPKTYANYMQNLFFGVKSTHHRKYNDEIQMEMITHLWDYSIDFYFIISCDVIKISEIV